MAGSFLFEEDDFSFFIRGLMLMYFLFSFTK